MSPVLELRGVTKCYGGRPAVQDVDLVIPRGTTTALIGPSGCGKSTVLRLLVGLVPPDAGAIVVAGEPWRDENALAWRRRLGYVIQEGGLFPHLTAAENVLLLARHLGWSEERRRARLDELTTLVGLEPSVLQRRPGALSGGQRQRVALMRALALDPDALLLDEPLGALDPLIRAGLQEDLRDIFQRLDKTVVLVTHDLAEASWFADAIALMQEGRIVQRGTLRELTDEPADEFVRRFVTAQRRLHAVGERPE